MKKNKSGFSLAEILIALAIISVIATACFSIAKRGIERAYDQYIYTGVQGLTEAIRYAKTQTYTDENGGIHTVDIINSTSNFYKHIKEALNGKETGNEAIILAPNNIKYTFKKYRATDNGISYTVTMKVPSSKNSAENSSEYILFYIADPQYEMIIPIRNSANTIRLDQRMDLLPYYIDNGTSGRFTINGPDKREFQKTQYYSFRDAFCRSYDPITTGNIYNVCNNIAKTTAGSVVLVNPRKLRAF